MEESSLSRHMDRLHGILMPKIRGLVIGGGDLDTYKVLFLWILKSVGCPVEGCPERENTPGRLRENFIYLH